MDYQILMLEASNEFQNNRWMAYDRHFRQQAASQPGCKWSAIDSPFWNFAFTGQAIVSTVLVCSISRKIANLFLLLLPVHMTHCHTKLLANVDLFVAGGMSNTLQVVPFRIAAMSTDAIIVPLIQHQRTVITKAVFCPNPPPSQSVTQQRPRPQLPWVIAIMSHSYHKLTVGWTSSTIYALNCLVILYVLVTCFDSTRMPYNNNNYNNKILKYVHSYN